MLSQIFKWGKEHQLAAFFILAFAISWIVQIPLALQAQGFINTRIPFGVHCISAYGPMLAAFLMTGLIGETTGMKELIARITKWRVRYVWWLVAVGPLIIMGIMALVNGLVQGNQASLGDFGQIDFLPNLGIGAVVFWIVTFGLGEETGWRGFALPRLQQGRSALSATLILWSMWALWHLPLFFYSYDVLLLPGFLMGLLAGAINFTWLYNSTGGSVLLTGVFHGLFNTVTACSACKASILAPVVSAIVMVWAVWIVILFKPDDLSTIRIEFESWGIVCALKGGS